MGKALYRKHRPRNLSEIVGQEHITTTLAKAISSGHISHAYLFTGPRGTGKTSIARILAHEVNGLPYTEDDIHLDIIEIDAASNRRIDEIRELKDRVNIAPTSSKYKVYIIDEVHMLTREAFNALLKTLEEPPEHVIFILATTEAHKLPDTIVSRTQRYSFKPVSQDQVVGELRRLATKEKLNIDDEALALVAQHGGGSFRDSISLLDQVRNTSDSIVLDDVQKALGQAPEELLEHVLSAVSAADIAAIAETIQAAQDQGIQAAQLAAQLSRTIRQSLIAGTLAQPSVVALLRDLLDVPSANNPATALELALYAHALSANPKPAQTDGPHVPTAKPSEPISTPPAKVPEGTKIPPESTKQPPQPKAEPKPAAKPDAPVSPETEPTTTDIREATDAPTQGDWQDILDSVKLKHNTLYGIARMAQPRFSPGSITLVFSFPFHHKRVSDTKNHAILSKIAHDVTGQKLIIGYELDTAKKPVVTDDLPSKPNLDISSITAVFGGGEVLDS